MKPTLEILGIFVFLLLAALLLSMLLIPTQPGYEDSPSLLLPHPVWGEK